MRPIAIFAVSLLLCVPAAGAQPTGTGVPALLMPETPDTPVEDFRWQKRVLIVFADSARDPRFGDQMRLLSVRTEDLAERDVVLLTDTDPDAKSALRQEFRPRGFMLVLLSKDGTVYLRKPTPWDTREISRSIDKLPLRQEEVRFNRQSNAE